MRARVFVASAAGAALVLAVSAASPASADAYDTMIAGSLGAGWTDFLTPQHSVEDWTANGSAVFTIDNPGFNIQANFSNYALQFPSSSIVVPATKTTPATTKRVPSQTADLWSYGGDIFWRDYAGEFGVNVNFASAVASGATTVTAGTVKFDTGTAAYQNYGWFGQFYALPDLTLELKGGRVQDGLEGWYGDGGAVFYPWRNLAINLTLDFANAQHVRNEMKDIAFGAEFLPVREIPVSMYMGYDYVQYSQLTPRGTNVFLVGLKAYLGGGGRDGTLVEYQRNGTTNWDGAPQQLLGLAF